MGQESDKQPFENRTRELLAESSARLDGRTQSRLTRARHAALARLGTPARAWWQGYLPAGAAAAAAVLAVFVWNGRTPGTRLPPAASTVASEANGEQDMDLLADADSPDFVDETEDPEFYEWAAGEAES